MTEQNKEAVYQPDEVNVSEDKKKYSLEELLNLVPKAAASLVFNPHVLSRKKLGVYIGELMTRDGGPECIITGGVPVTSIDQQIYKTGSCWLFILNTENADEAYVYLTYSLEYLRDFLEEYLQTNGLI